MLCGPGFKDLQVTEIISVMGNKTMYYEKQADKDSLIPWGFFLGGGGGGEGGIPLMGWVTWLSLCWVLTHDFLDPLSHDSCIHG